MSNREELLIAVAVALLVGYVLGQKVRQAKQASAEPPNNPMGWLNSYSA